MVKKTEKRKIILSAIVIVQVIVLLIVSSYGWLVNNWSPAINEQNIQIAATGGLLIGLTGEDGDPVYDDISLKKIMGTDSFVFKQVSSADGKNFFWLDYSPSLEGDPAVLRRANAAENGYIDVDFCLITESSSADKYVYLHHDTWISMADPTVPPEYDVPSAIRIALTFKGTAAQGYEDETRIFGINRENVTAADFPDLVGASDADFPDTVDELTNAVGGDADEKTLVDPEANQPQRVFCFSDFNGGRDSENKETAKTQIEEGKVLYTMRRGETRWVNLKIWLEGGSENCKSTLAGLSFGLILKFGSSNVPSLSP